jgi:glycyl-tRNA synthetase
MNNKQHVSASNIEEDIKTLLKKSQYISPSFELYGSPSGFQTYGVLGTAFKRRIIDLWRHIFCPMNRPDTFSVYEIDTPIIGPDRVYIASGHVERFTDPVVKDKNGRIERVDHYVKARIRLDTSLTINDKESLINSLDNLTDSELQVALSKFGDPTRKFGDIYKQNLMLNTSTSLTNTISYLRPEMAQGLITEFKNIYKFNCETLPFGIAQIGRVYRKEISTRPFTRLTEFEQAEIEVFNDPTKSIELSEQVTNTIINVFNNYDQESGNIYDYNTCTKKLGDMVESGLNSIIAFFMYKIKVFVKKLGIDPARIRFRQHLKNELAHYSSDCWDMEYLIRDRSTILNFVDPLETNWIEVIGIADRGCYDLTQHHCNAISNTSMKVKRVFNPPVERTVIETKFNMKPFCKKFNKESQLIKLFIENKCQSNMSFVDEIIQNNVNGAPTVITFNNIDYIIDTDMVSVIKSVKMISHEEFIPHIIEPSIGIDRLVYAVLNSRYWVRPEDSERCVLSLTPEVAPIQVVILPLFTKDIIMQYVPIVENIVSKITTNYKIDSSGASIGKKYSRFDEIGVPYAITIDYQTDDDKSVTIRNRDDTTQIRVKIEDLSKYISS